MTKPIIETIDFNSVEKYKVNFSSEEKLINMSSKYSDKIISKYPFFKNFNDLNVNYGSGSQNIIIKQLPDDYFLVKIDNGVLTNYYILDQFNELMIFLKKIFIYKINLLIPINNIETKIEINYDTTSIEKYKTNKLYYDSLKSFQYTYYKNILYKYPFFKRDQILKDIILLNFDFGLGLGFIRVYQYINSFGLTFRYRNDIFNFYVVERFGELMDILDLLISFNKNVINESIELDDNFYYKMKSILNNFQLIKNSSYLSIDMSTDKEIDKLNSLFGNKFEMVFNMFRQINFIRLKLSILDVFLYKMEDDYYLAYIQINNNYKESRKLDELCNKNCSLQTGRFTYFDFKLDQFSEVIKLFKIIFREDKLIKEDIDNISIPSKKLKELYNSYTDL